MPGSNTRVCLYFVCMTSLQEGAGWLKFNRQFVALLYLPVSLVSQRLRERGGRGKMDLIVLEVTPAGSKPPAADDSMRTSTSGRCGFGASAPFSTRASSLHIERAGGSAILPKLVGPSTARAEEISPCFSSYAAAPSVRLRVFVCFYVCLGGEMWLLSFMLESCLTLICVLLLLAFEPFYGRSGLSIYRSFCPVLLQLFGTFLPS